MPTVLVANDIRIVIYLNDHAPAHVHATRDDGEARIDIANDPVLLLLAHGLSRADVRRALRIVAENRAHLLQSG
jgi:hypothetical protein